MKTITITIPEEKGINAMYRYRDTGDPGWDKREIYYVGEDEHIKDK